MDIIQSYLAWFYWDPDRVLFTVPIINRPIAWYGAFFVVGFIVGYFYILSMLKKHILYAGEITGAHISNWSALINELQKVSDVKENPAQVILANLNGNARKEILALKASDDIKPSLKTALLQSINEALHSKIISRKELQELFPNAIIKAGDLSMILTDRLSWFTVGGTIIGARLGEVFFYNWPYYWRHPEEIIKIWHGGLASHGATLGILAALAIYYQKYLKKILPSVSFVGLIDIVCVPTAFAAFCIRLGNFFNQEIVGTETTLPWGVIFGHPADYGDIVPRHPTQLYEGICYLLIFIILATLWNRRGLSLRPGFLCGLFFILVFGSRFFLEFVKSTQDAMIDQSFLQMGQWLSIPFVMLGFWLLFFYKERGRKFSTKTELDKI